MITITEKNLTLKGDCAFADFQLDAYAQLEIKLDIEHAAEIELVLGEVAEQNKINREPGGYRIVRSMKKSCPAGKSSFAFELPEHCSPYHYTNSVSLPPEAENNPITPFRYVEINGGTGKATLVRKAIYGEFDDNASDFKSDNPTLNRIWEFCKYTMKATAAFGLYIDGERERQPYEGDALINQLGDLCSGGSAETARKTINWLIETPTHFTEWQLITPILARDYLLYTGDKKSCQKWLPALEKQIRKYCVREDNLLHQPDYMRKLGDTALVIKDLIDWPISERDNYDFQDVNLVPNCCYYASLLAMYEISGKESYKTAADAVKKAINEKLVKNNMPVDSLDSTHTALHSLFYPVYCKVMPLSDNMAEIIRRKGMSCSVYMAQYLLEMCFDNGMEDHAFKLLLSKELRSYSNMIAKGATMAMESWDDSCKPNQDWNHAWGAAPANLIPRCIAGIKPLEAGFKKFSVTPHPGKLQEFYMKHPTPNGSIILKYKNNTFALTVPEGSIAVTSQGELPAGKYIGLDLKA